jgi:outer membrane protein assembly factor BamB
MRVYPTVMAVVAAVIFLWPVLAFAKRRAPKPAPPVVSEGVEYRAPLSVEQPGHVEAVELATGKKLWDTEVYHVWIMPLAETDVQWVFITSLQIQNGKLLVSNEDGRRYRVDLKTGHFEGAMCYWLPWPCLGTLLFLAGYFVWRRL